MAGDKKIENSEPIATGVKSDALAKPAEKDVVPKKGEMVTSGGNTNKGETNQAPALDQGLYYPTSCYNYLYPGYNGTYPQLDASAYYNAGAASYNGVQTENGAVMYYMPGYNPYTTYLGADGKQYYGDMQCYYDPTYAGEMNVPATNNTKPTNIKSPPSQNSVSQNQNQNQNQNAQLKSNGFNPSAKTTSPTTPTTNGNNVSTKSSTLPLNSKARQFDVSKPVVPTQPLKPFNKLGGSGYQSQSMMMKGNYPLCNGKYSSYANQNQGLYMHYTPMNYNRVWNGNPKYKSRGNFGRNGDFEASSELTRGPRGHSRSVTPKEDSEVEKVVDPTSDKKYNLEDFPLEYENAKFYVIKSYSEDDIHKCVKYDVWSSTPNGNKKLNAAFIDAESKATETGKKCPIFLFFSVNGSGQFLGVAEMMGQVDFNKNMEFWQLDKWNGFFPVKWHMVKDVPNTQLRHIILETNENRPVTYSRDTQEIGLNQGLEMLKIFKSFTAKTSLLDDFNFYEEREKSLKARRNSYKQESEFADVIKPDDGSTKEGEKVEEGNVKSDLVNLTQNLSLNSQQAVKGSA